MHCPWMSLDVLGIRSFSAAFKLCFRPANRATVDVVFGITVTATSLLLGEVGLVMTRVRTRRSPRPDTGIRRQSASHASPRQVDLQNGWEFTELHEVGSVFLVALCGACPFRHPACQTAEAPGESTMGATKYVRLHGPWAQLF